MKTLSTFFVTIAIISGIICGFLIFNVVTSETTLEGKWYQPILYSGVGCYFCYALSVAINDVKKHISKD